MTQTLNTTRPNPLMIVLGVVAALAVSVLQQGAPHAAIVLADETRAAVATIDEAFHAALRDETPVMGSGSSRQLRQYSKAEAEQVDAPGGIEALPLMGSGDNRPLAEFGIEAYQSRATAKID